MSEEKMKYNIINYTLVFIRNNSKILLGMKKKGLGVNKYNGFGGKLEPNETILECALRELKEESYLKGINLKHIGVCLYEVMSIKRVDFVHIFTTNEYSGVPKESDEMIPKWFDINKIPYDQMWADAKWWHPFMLKDKYFLNYVVYKDEDTIIKRDLNEYESISSVLKDAHKLKTNLESKVIDT